MVGLGITEIALLGLCCVAPIFVIGIIAFFLMFRGGSSSAGAGQDFGGYQGGGRSGGGASGTGGNYGGASGGGNCGTADPDYGKKPRDKVPGEFTDKKPRDKESEEDFGKGNRRDDNFGKNYPGKGEAAEDGGAKGESRREEDGFGGKNESSDQPPPNDDYGATSNEKEQFGDTSGEGDEGSEK